MISTDQIYLDTLWLFNIAMENGPFIDGLPIENGDFPWQTVTNIQIVYIYICKIRARSKGGTCRRDFWPMWSEKAARGCAARYQHW